jgi:predicted ABC-type ATPase
MLEELAFHAGRGRDFGLETTLAGKGYLRVLRGLKERGYQIHIFYLWVPGAELALSRIRERVLRGGHHVAEETVRRRYKRSIRNFLIRYRVLADGWILYDNGAPTPVTIASEEEGKALIVDRKRYSEVAARYGIT